MLSSFSISFEIKGDKMESITFGNYDVREDGEIYSHYSHRYLKHDISKLGYH